MQHRICLLLASALFSSAAAQFGNWPDGQVNTSICIWVQPRVALIRDTVYIDGGALSWMPEFADRVGPAVPDNDPRGLIYTYNLTRPVDRETNVTGLLIENTIPKPPGGESANFQDGAMLANDAEFLLYGGNMKRIEGLVEPPDGDEILGYQIYRYGAERSWVSQFDEVTLSNRTHRYIAYGGAASAPSENKAWYFSGMTSPSVGELESIVVPDRSMTAQNISNYLIEVDMAVQSSEVWTNTSLPETVQGRANPEVVWVPVGEQGILVVLGGVTYPHWAGKGQESDDRDASEEESPAFMQEIDIYDIAGKDWYKQPTEGGPGARTRGCAVVATASDRSSFNIYYYGGFNGIDPSEPFSDDVWVLSLPSFAWTRVNNGTSLHARAGHKCFTPYVDQMLVVGGYTTLSGLAITCLEDGPLVFFNLSSAQWMDSYHPDNYDDYGVPDRVVDKIGGNAAGGATLVTPTPSGWADDSLEEIFSVSYETSKITTWGPYSTVDTPTDRPGLPNDDNNSGGGGGLPSWVAPVLGVVLGLMLLTGALVVFFLCRRRKNLRNSQVGGSSDASTEDGVKRISQWVRQNTVHDHTGKTPTVTTSETPGSPGIASVSAMRSEGYPSPPLERTFFHETAGNPIAELPGTSVPAELSDGRVTPHSHFGNFSNPSYSSFSAQGAEANSTSLGSSTAAAAAANQEESPVAPDYLGLGSGHIRSLSETLAASKTQPASESQDQESGSASRPAPAMRRESDQISEAPISPPTMGDFPGEDYITARTAMETAIVSPMRKSVFHESEEDMEKK